MKRVGAAASIGFILALAALGLTTLHVGRVDELGFYLGLPGFLAALGVFGGHGDGGHYFEWLALGVNSTVFALLFLGVSRVREHFASKGA